MKKLLAFTCIIAISCGLYSQESINKAQFIEKVWDFENYKDAIKLKSKVPVILDFYADWCRPCKMLEPELTALQKDYKGKLIIYRINVDKERNLAALFQASSLPTIFFIDKSGTATYVRGYRTKEELKQMVDTYLITAKKAK